MDTRKNQKQDKNVLYESVNTHVDMNTGEILTEVTEKVVKVNPEPPYIKMYIDDLCAIVNTPNSLKDVLLLAVRKLDYEGYISLTTRYRKQMCEILGIKDGTLRNRINMLVKKGFLKSVGGSEYKANPYYFARGDWRTIVELRQDFQLVITYSADGSKKLEAKVAVEENTISPCLDGQDLY
ncbi:hypothetical protein [Providencia stuartii]|uniref:hypothetical protein n=1 Tax=Providencia stuartii TaxID=588 RepID=UPI00381BF0C3